MALKIKIIMIIIIDVIVTKKGLLRKVRCYFKNVWATIIAFTKFAIL